MTKYISVAILILVALFIFSFILIGEKSIKEVSVIKFNDMIESEKQIP